MTILKDTTGHHIFSVCKEFWAAQLTFIWTMMNVCFPCPVQIIIHSVILTVPMIFNCRIIWVENSSPRGISMCYGFILRALTMVVLNVYIVCHLVFRMIVVPKIKGENVLNIDFSSVWVQAYLDTLLHFLCHILTKLTVKKAVICGRAQRKWGHLASDQGFKEKLLSNISASWFTLFGKLLA